jgi:hypothetical protein
MIIYEQYEYKGYLVAIRKHPILYVASIFYPIPTDALDSTVPTLRIKYFQHANHNWVSKQARNWIDSQGERI